MTGAILKSPDIKSSGNTLEVSFKRPFNQIKALSDNIVKGAKAYAVTDNLDEIKPPTNLIKENLIVLNSNTYTDFQGPNISLKLSNASPSDTLITMANLAGYNFVYSPNPTIESDQDSLSNGLNMSLINQPYSIALNAIINASNYQIRKVNDLIILCIYNFQHQTFH